MKRWLYEECWWAIHNILAHPVSQVLWWCSLFGLIGPVAAAAEWVHDWTVPADELDG